MAKRSRLPKSVLLCHCLVPVQRYDADGEFGEWHWHPAPLIRIDRNTCDNVAAMTLFHESLHAVSDMHGLGLNENQVRTLEVAVAAALRDNPRLAEMLCHPAE